MDLRREEFPDIRVYTSPVKRCIQTAEAITPDINVRSSLNTMDLGDCRGMTVCVGRSDPMEGRNVA
jgi:broad specificity phosphatase PhoE